MNTSEGENLEEILDAILKQEGQPTHEALERWSTQYPKFRKELADFFVTWAEQMAQPETAPVDEEAINSQLVSHALNLLHRQQSKHAEATAAATCVKPLREAIKERGRTEADFAKHCNLDTSLVAKLDRCLINPETIPRWLVRRASEFLQLTRAAVEAIFCAPPSLAGQYKARHKPSLRTEDFLVAVQSSELPPEAKVEWARLVASEGKEGNSA